MNKKILVVILVVASSLGVLSACARTVRITSEPVGAIVRVDGIYRGETPTTAPMHCATWGKRPTVEIHKAGYSKVTTEVAYHPDLRNIVLDALLFYPALLFNANCPESEYHFLLEKIETTGEKQSESGANNK